MTGWLSAMTTAPNRGVARGLKETILATHLKAVGEGWKAVNP